MGLGERIKEFTPVKRYLIYKRINTNPPVVIYDNDFIYKMGADEYFKMGFKERIELARGDAKGKKLIFEAIEKIRNSRTDSYFSIHNSQQVNDEIYRNDQKLVRELIDTLRNEFKKDPYIPEREMALDTMDIELNELVEHMNKARINVKDDLARREEVWDIPEGIPQQNFSINKWMRLKNLNDKYFGTNDEGLKKIEEAILWKSSQPYYNIKGTIETVQRDMMQLQKIPKSTLWAYEGDFITTIQVNDKNRLINKEYFDKLLGQMNNDLLVETRPETLELIKTQITKVEEMKEDHSLMRSEWVKLQKAVIRSEPGQPYGESEINRLTNAYHNLCILEKKYKKYNDGKALERLEKFRECLGLAQDHTIEEKYDSYGFAEPANNSLRVLEERILQERLDEANSKGSGEVAKKNGERNMAEAGKEIKGRSSSERDGR